MKVLKNTENPIITYLQKYVENLLPNAIMFLFDITNNDTTHLAGVIISNLHFRIYKLKIYK